MCYSAINDRVNLQGQTFSMMHQHLSWMIYMEVSTIFIPDMFAKYIPCTNRG